LEDSWMRENVGISGVLTPLQKGNARIALAFSNP
jgi:hypothetical protein